MYEVTTIGRIGDLPGMAGQEWPDIPPGWVPAGTPGLPGRPAPVPGPPRGAGLETVSAPMVAMVAIGGVLVGALGLWALARYA